MRKSIAVLLIALSVTLGMPTVASAQAGRSALLNGQIVDAGGRGSSGRSVELISDGMVVGMTTSSVDGHFSFAIGGAGTYIVRTIVNGHPAGIRVSVVKGQNPPMALLVLPSAVTASAQAGVLISGGLSALASVASVTVSLATAAIVTQLEEKDDDQILNSAETRELTVRALNLIVQQISPGAPAITISATGAIVIPPGLAATPGFTPAIIGAIQQVVVNVPTGSGSGN